MVLQIQTVLAAASIYACSSIAETQEAGPSGSSNDWLLNAQSDEERFTLLQQQLRGFDQPMWEVGERFQRIHDALERENYQLAVYHWDKIKTTIENALVKRPARRANAEALFLTGPYGDALTRFQSGDPQQAWDGFDIAKAACQSCHVAEGVPFMNDQPVFDLVRPGP